MTTEYMRDGSRHSRNEARRVKFEAMGVEEAEKKGARNGQK